MQLSEKSKKLRIIHVEDNREDRELVTRELWRNEIEVEITYAASETEFRNVLETENVDVVLADYTLPGFSGMAALQIAKELRPDLPFIFLSGTIDEQQAIETLRCGASDYVFKKYLRQLPSAIERTLREARQIAERHQAEQALRASEERFRQLTDTIEEVFWLVNVRTGRLLYVSPAYEKIWGRSGQALYDNPKEWQTSLHPGDRDRLISATCLPTLENTDREFRIIRPDGQVRWINARTFPILDSSGAPCRVAGVATDITEKKKLEAQFLRAQRMESIGTLAGGIAHDLNNALSPIVMSIDLLREKLRDPESQKVLNAVEASARRGASMVKQLLTFARGIEGRHIQIQLKHLVAEVETILRQTLPKNITIRTVCPKDGLWTVVGDATQLHQVLLNLCVNARDAMPQGGCLTIKASNFEADENIADTCIDARLGPYVELSIADTGVGIPVNILDRIFDPFFTTKPVDKGTGLGLSTVKGIVQSHGGFVTVYSEVGRGSDFKVYLPAKRETASHFEHAEAAAPVEGKGELILVVDDEESIRTLTQRTLEAFNYKVLTAPNGAEGIALCAREMTNIRVLLTDISMPVVDGIGLITTARRLAPNLKIIAASGLDAIPDKSHQPAYGADSFLPKPFTAELLLRTVRNLIDN